MANPYKKAEQVQKKAPGSRQEPTKVEEVKILPEKVEEVKPAQPEVKAPVEKEVSTDFFAGFEEKKPKGNSRAFYIDDEVFAAIEKLAAQKKLSNSKVVNTILRNVLIK